MTTNNNEEKEFGLIAYGCLSRRREAKFELISKDLGWKKKIWRDSCVGDDFEYLVEEEGGGDYLLKIRPKSPGSAEDQKPREILLSKQAPLLERLTNMAESGEVGVLEKQNLVYFRDQRFLYLLDLATKEVNQSRE